MMCCYVYVICVPIVGIQYGWSKNYCHYYVTCELRRERSNYLSQALKLVLGAYLVLFLFLLVVVTLEYVFWIFLMWQEKGTMFWYKVSKKKWIFFLFFFHEDVGFHLNIHFLFFFNYNWRQRVNHIFSLQILNFL